MGHDIRETDERPGPRTGSGSGAALGKGYGAGGLGGEPGSWDAPGITPDGHRTGSPDDGPRTAMDGEGEPDPDHDHDHDHDEA